MQAPRKVWKVKAKVPAVVADPTGTSVSMAQPTELALVVVATTLQTT